MTSRNSSPTGRYLAILTIGALGVVYGDIGTSVLYALRECFHGVHAISVTPDNVLGVLSLIFWALTLLVSIKYLVFVMRADNRGEGGVLALIALVSRHPSAKRRSRTVLITLGLFGSALLYGDGMLTPAISVLSAVEGLKIATNVFEPYVIPKRSLTGGNTERVDTRVLQVIYAVENPDARLFVGQQIDAFIEQPEKAGGKSESLARK